MNLELRCPAKHLLFSRTAPSQELRTRLDVPFSRVAWTVNASGVREPHPDSHRVSKHGNHLSYVLTLKNWLLYLQQQQPFSFLKLQTNDVHFRVQNAQQFSELSKMLRSSDAMIRINSTATANSYKRTVVHVTSSANKEKVPCTSAPLIAKISLPLGRSHHRV
jgi:hypothetical protein